MAPKTASPRSQNYPRKPTSAQIERFEVLRARVMGLKEPDVYNYQEVGI